MRCTEQAGQQGASRHLDDARFAVLWRRLGAAGSPDAVFAALSAAYAEPHRAYHGADHINDCLTQFDAVSELAHRPDEVEIALWFHDAVYDPRASDNEEKSAVWAVQALSSGGISAETAARVSHLVLATKHSALPHEPDAQFVTDIDLSILGRSPEVLDRKSVV